MNALRDLRFGARLLIKRPGLTAIAVVALGLGIGLTTTMFSIVYGAIIRGLPFERSERILHLERANPSEGIRSVAVPIHDFVDWRAQQKSFEDFTAFYLGTVNVSGAGGKPERYDGAFTTANMFDLLRIRPLFGRTFREGDDRPGGEPVVVIGFRLWQERFGGDRGVLGRTIRANGEVMTVIGVMPEKFLFPLNEEIWLPLRLNPLATKRGEGTFLEVIGRLRDGATIDQARAEFAAIAKRLEQEYPETNKGYTVLIKPFVAEFIGEEAVAMLYTMLGAVFCVLLIACANVANLLLARAALRTKEVAIRSALGASRFRVIGQLLVETLLLAVAGGAMGVIIASVGVRLFNDAIVDATPPFWIDIKIDPAVLLFVVGLVLLASLIAGLVPAIQASRADVNEVLKDESRGSSSLRLGRFSKGLVIGEIALSCGLLVAAGLMIKSVVRLKSIEFPFATEDVFTARVGLFDTDYPDKASRARFYEELVRRLEGKPGVRSVALTSNLPSTGSEGLSFAVQGKSYPSDADYPRTRRAVVTPGFFEMFGTRVMSGRDLARSDTADSLPVAVVNQSFARKHLPGGDPLGRRIRVGRSSTDQPWLTIVGVVPDFYIGDLDGEEKNPDGFYVPLAQDALNFMSIAIRAQGPPLALTSMVRGEVTALDPNLPIYFVRSMPQVIQRNTWFYGVFGSLFMIFGFAALFLASVGLYGVMAFSVSSRTQEIGVRMALGAQARDVLTLIMRQGVIELAIGLFLGLGLAAGLSRMLKILLFEVEPWDPAIFGYIVAVLAATCIVACLVPAQRAMRVDPMEALRYE